jgi:phosphoribosylformylglycinamidine (FGAM) synthase-like enzyme
MEVYTLKNLKPQSWTKEGRSLYFLTIKNPKDLSQIVQNLFGEGLEELPEENDLYLFRSYLPGVSNPLSESLAKVLKIPSKDIRVDQALELKSPLTDKDLSFMQSSWREPAIETLKSYRISDYYKWLENLKTPERTEDSFDNLESPHSIGLEFSPEELAVLNEASLKNKRSWNRAEWELFAQSWSEHCKHKIFNAHIEVEENIKVNSIFKSYLRKPALDLANKNPQLFLSLFHDNAGVIRIFHFKNSKAEATSWALAAKMETHNSPSAISPYGGASTGIVGVHRDILGTGLGALPVTNWDVLCFESPKHKESRPSNALAPEIIRSGVIRGIQDGGNQSGIPTLQGSVVFDPGYAIKPLVYAGSLGILPVEMVQKKATAGDKLFLIGGATGADGLRGAVMSSRDIRGEDFSGSMVQVANPYTQRTLTDFLIDARNKGLISAVTDNGAGGMASSVGEMATLTGGAKIDLSNIRLKYEGLLQWEKLLSESQERMTLATHKPQELKALLQEWDVEFDELGELNNTGFFHVSSQGKDLVNISLELLHEQCPQLKLKSGWTFEKEKLELSRESKNSSPSTLEEIKNFFTTCHGASREEILRRFDHEVQGRSPRKAFAGLTQSTPQEGSLIEVPEAGAYVALGHGLAPREKDFALSVLKSFDESMKRYLLATGQLQYSALLDNFSWPDPLNNDRSLWKLQLANEILALITEKTKIPFISGKDSMKNNDTRFRVPETLVISTFGSALGPEHAPSGFLLKDGLKIFDFHPLEENFILASNNRAELMNKIDSTLEGLMSRYEAIQKWIQEKALWCAKDYSQHHPLKSLFEMSLGRELGIEFSLALEKILETKGSLGAFHLVFAPEHPAPAELILVGTSQKDFEFSFEDKSTDLSVWRDNYKTAGRALWQ